MKKKNKKEKQLVRLVVQNKDAGKKKENFWLSNQEGKKRIFFVRKIFVERQV